MPLRDMDREQMWLLPPSLDELLSQDHPARFVAEFVDALNKEDWSELGVDIEGDSMGAPAYHPRALLSVWLYGFMTGVRSCRKLEVACRDQIPYLWLTGWQHPDHNTLWRFYKEHRQSMRRLFERTVQTAVVMELVDLAVQAVDGTKVASNASVNSSYDQEGLRRLLDRLENAIADLDVKGGGKVDHVGEMTADLRLSKSRINVLYSVRDGNRCWRRRSCWGSPRRRTLGVDVSPYRLSVDSQLPRHPSNGHPPKLGLPHSLPFLLLEKRRLPRRCDDP